MKGFSRKQILIINFYEMPKEFQQLFCDQIDAENRNRGYNRYCSEFTPSAYDSDDYGHTFTSSRLSQYWKDQTENNNYKGTLEDFIEDYNLKVVKRGDET